MEQCNGASLPSQGERIRRTVRHTHHKHCMASLTKQAVQGNHNQTGCLRKIRRQLRPAEEMRMLIRNTSREPVNSIDQRQQSHWDWHVTKASNNRPGCTIIGGSTMTTVPISTASPIENKKPHKKVFNKRRSLVKLRRLKSNEIRWTVWVTNKNRFTTVKTQLATPPQSYTVKTT